MSLTSVQERIKLTCEEIEGMLLAKNADYGNSALEPVRIFSGVDAREQLRVRIDDKLSRIKNRGLKNFRDEDTIKDLVGYLILLLVAQKYED